MTDPLTEGTTRGEGERAELAERLAYVRTRIDEALQRSGRRGDDVLLVAVTKTFGLDTIKAALQAGLTDLGENRAQELREKALVVGGDVRWHFIGHLQTNKVRQVFGCTLIHSVDRIGLAEAISRRAATAGGTQDVLIEVNVSGEGSKHGIEPARVQRLTDAVAGLERLRLRGLMTMAPHDPDPEKARPVFAELRELSEQVQAAHPDATELSMGMSGDYVVAVEEGATIVRVGSALFGPRRAR